jgi:GPH family glycoside/pentoside/hexuronide:cation symporter
MPFLVVQNVLTVLCILAALILLTSMVADVGEHFQLKTGRRMEGLMFAALIMINKAVSGMGVLFAGLVLSAIDFPEKARPGEVDPQVIHQLGWIYVGSMALLCLLAIVALSFYPITREAHRRMLEQLGQA